MNLKYMKVSLFEISYKKKMNFNNIQIFWDVPVQYIFWKYEHVFCVDFGWD